MKYRELFIRITLALCLCPAGAMADAPAAPNPAPASTPTAAQRLSRIALYRQLNALNFTPGQVLDIGRRLTQLAAADRDYQSKQSNAGKDLSSVLQRMEDALFLGRTPDAGDETQARTALSPLTPDGERVAQLRTQTIDIIRRELRPPQMAAIRRYLEIPPDRLPQMSGGVTFGGGPPGAVAQAGPDAPANPAAGPKAPPDPMKRIYDLMDRYRRMPQPDFDREKHDADAGKLMLNMSGVAVTDPDFTAENNGVSFFDEMAQMRQLSDALYQEQRDELADGLAQQFQTYTAGHPQAAIMAQGPGAVIAAGQSAETDLDNEAIRRFFLQPDVLRYLQARLPR